MALDAIHIVGKHRKACLLYGSYEIWHPSPELQCFLSILIFVIHTYVCEFVAAVPVDILAYGGVASSIETAMITMLHVLPIKLIHLLLCFGVQHCVGTGIPYAESRIPMSVHHLSCFAISFYSISCSRSICGNILFAQYPKNRHMLSECVIMLWLINRLQGPVLI